MGRAASAGLRHRWTAIFAVAAALLILLGGSWSQLWHCDMSGHASTGPCPCTADAPHDDELQSESPTQAERPQCCARSQAQDVVATAAVASPESTSVVTVLVPSETAAMDPTNRVRLRAVRPRGPPPSRAPAYLSHQAFLL